MTAGPGRCSAAPRWPPRTQCEDLSVRFSGPTDTKRNRKKETKMRKSRKNKRRWSALNIYLGTGQGSHQQQDFDALRVQLPPLQQLQLLVRRRCSQLLQLLHDGIVGQDGGVQRSQTSGRKKAATFYHRSHLPGQHKKGNNLDLKKKKKYRHS